MSFSRFYSRPAFFGRNLIAFQAKNKPDTRALSTRSTPSNSKSPSPDRWAIYVGLASVWLTIQQQYNILGGQLGEDQRKACNKLHQEQYKGEEAPLKEDFITSCINTIKPRFDLQILFPELNPKSMMDLCEMLPKDNPQTQNERVEAYKPLEDALTPRLERGAKNNKDSSTAYSLAAILQPAGKDVDVRKTTTIRDPSLRFLRGRCFFPISADDYWKLITSVHTLWDDPNCDTSLNAHSPWGDLRYEKHGDEVLCTFRPNKTVDNIQGRCTHFGFWDEDETGAKLLGELNKPNWLVNYFAIHMQEETAHMLYKYAYKLAQANGIPTGPFLERNRDIRSRALFKEEAIKLFDQFLVRYSTYIPEYQNDKVDTLSAPPSLRNEVLVWREGQLHEYMTKANHKLESKDEQLYQAILAAKMRRLARKAAVYDDRFDTWRCRNGRIWVG